jgi:hypothetical protein
MVVQITPPAFPFISDVVVVARHNAASFQLGIGGLNDINDSLPFQYFAGTRSEQGFEAVMICAVWHDDLATLQLILP